VLFVEGVVCEVGFKIIYVGDVELLRTDTNVAMGKHVNLERLD
jgi:hypothetical protein